ncbi:MAG: DUF4124 domain-containing protein [Burkholderiaceae bacterium]
MTKPFSLLLAASLLMAAPAAFAQIYRCESENGVTVYQGSSTGKNCRALDLAPLTTIPAPKLPPSKPAGGGAAAGTASGGSSATTASAPRTSPEAFPKVDASVQRSRDNDRRRILQSELQKEEAKLAELKGEYKDGEPDRLGNERNYQKYLDRVQRLKEDIGRSEANLASIRRELGMIKD